MSVSASGWPVRQKGPRTSNEYDKTSNPVVRGWTLAGVTYLLTSSSLIQGIFWRNNKFDRLKHISQLSTVEPRHDPTVAPAVHESGKLANVSDLVSATGRKRESAYYTIGDFTAAYKSGKVTPTSVVESILELIQDHGKSPSRYSIAYLQVKPELALAAAKASTERWKQGKPLSPVDGVPIAVKDQVDLQGYPKSLGSPLDLTNPLNITGWCVKKWEEAGAIIIGKTNQHQFGMDTNGNNPWRGTPRMPHNEGYYPGGSSSGSAVTIAQGICPIALGTDGGGSIRVPSSFCGIYGLKTSHGRVSARPTLDCGSTVGVYGPMASDLESLEIAYRIMAQPDPEDRRSVLFPSPLQTDFNTKSRNKTIGICKEWVARSDPDVLELFNKAVQYYQKTYSYKVVDIDIPYLPEGQKAHAMTILSEVRSSISQAQLNQLSYPNQLLLTVAGSNATGQDFLAAQKIRNVMMEHLAWLWEQYPDMLILTPTIPFAGWKIERPGDIVPGYGVSDSDTSLRSMEYVYVANWTGCPAISRPMGYAKDNLPVGLMAMGPWGDEEHLIAWAKQGEGLLDEGSPRRPIPDGNWVDVLKGVKG